jgi:hypothetical protein
MVLRLTFILTAILFSGVSWSQKPEKKVDHSAVDQSGQACHAFMFSADYASNTNVLGNFSNFSRQPYYSPSVSFFSKWGADVSLIGYAIGNSDDSLDHFTTEMDLVLGYGFEPVKNLAVYANYSHFTYSGNSNSIKSIFSDDLHVDLDYTYKFADLGVSAGYLTGRQHTFYLSLHNYYVVNFNHILFRTGYLNIQPGIDANFGDYEYLNLYYLDELSENGKFSHYLTLNPYMRRYVYSQKLKNPDQRREEILYHFLREKAKDTFKFTSASINLPLSYTMGNFTLNLGIYVIIPVNQPDYLSNEIQFFFNMGLTYLLISD